MELRNKFLFYLTNFYLFSTAIGWIGLHIYFRLIKERTPLDLDIIKNHINTKTVYLVSMIILIQIIILLVTSLELYKYYFRPNKEETFLIKSFKPLIDWLYWKPLNFIYNLIMAKTPGSGQTLQKIAEILYRHDPAKRTFIISAIIFDYLPRLIVMFSLFIDIFIFHKIYYFILTIGLILIPLLFQVMIKSLTDFWERNLPTIEQVVEVQPDLEKGIEWFFFLRRPPYEFLSEGEFQEWVDFWKVVSNLKIFTNAFTFHKYEYYSFVTIICSSGYVFSWSYYLWYILGDSPHKGIIYTQIYDLLCEILIIYKYIEEPFSGLFLF